MANIEKIVKPQSKGKKEFKKTLTGLLFALPYLIIFSTFFIYPFFYGVAISFFKWNIFQPQKTEFIGFANYITLLFGDVEGAIPGAKTISSYFWSGLWHTVLFVIISVPLLLIIPLFLAILLNKEPKGYKVFRTLLFMPTVLSVSAVGIIWKWLFDTNLGFVNNLLSAFNITGPSWFQDESFGGMWAWIVIILCTIWWTLGTNMVIFGAGLKEVDKSVYEAADLDGAGRFRKFFKITLPGIKNQLFLCLINTTIGSFNVYGQVDILTGGGPNHLTQTIMMHIRGYAFGANALPGLSAAMAIVLGLIIISIGLIQNVVVNKEKKSKKLRRAK